MPEYVEYVWFARFLEIWSLFLGPIVIFEQRAWPNQMPANVSPNTINHGIHAAKQLQELFSETQSFVHWYPFGKFLIGEFTDLNNSTRVWLKVSLAQQGYPMLLDQALNQIELANIQQTAKFNERTLLQEQEKLHPSKSNASGFECIEEQFLIGGENLAIVFLDKQNFSSFTVFTSKVDLMASLALPHPIIAPLSISNIIEAKLSNSRTPLGFALQELHCGFGTYTTSEFIAAADIDPNESAAEVLANAQTFQKFWQTLANSSIASLAGQTCFYNPGDIVWKNVNSFRSKLLVYRQQGTAKCVKGPLKYHTLSHLVPEASMIRKNQVLSVNDNKLGVGPFEWNEKKLLKKPCTDWVQEETFCCMTALASPTREKFNYWLEHYSSLSPPWAVSIVQLSDRNISLQQATTLATYLIACLRGFSSYLPLPQGISGSLLFRRLPNGVYLPRYITELDYLLATPQELQSQNLSLHCMLVGDLKKQAKSVVCKVSQVPTATK